MPPSVDPEKQMHEGPWLDRLFPIHLPGGRMVSVTGFSVLPSNIRILEGGLTPEMNAHQRETVLEIAKKRFGSPVLAIEPVIEPLPEFSTPTRRRERLPWMACLARLTSTPLDPEMVASELTLVWSQDAFEMPLPQELERPRPEWTGGGARRTWTSRDLGSKRRAPRSRNPVTHCTALAGRGPAPPHARSAPRRLLLRESDDGDRRDPE